MIFAARRSFGLLATVCRQIRGGCGTTQDKRGMPTDQYKPPQRPLCTLRAMHTAHCRILHLQCEFLAPIVHSAHTSSCYPVLVHIDTQLCAISTHRALLTKLNTALPFVQCTLHPRTLDSPEITLVPSNLLPLVASPLCSVLPLHCVVALSRCTWPPFCRLIPTCTEDPQTLPEV